ncbi:MAG: FlxA-like family protein [Coraliomargarita sp.]|nr:FlxA-like family protein [Coraliomargarita sp.]
MDDSLEELKRQRALIQQHIEWLDTEIVKLEPAPSEEAPEIYEKPESTSDEDLAGDSNSKSKPSIAEAMMPKEPQVYGDVKVAQIGCIAFFVLGIAGFLFFLFGLPYLLD